MIFSCRHVGRREFRSRAVNERTDTLGGRSGEPVAVALVPSREIKRKLTRRRILRAALIEFARQGLDGAAVKTISERAGVANGTVFWHFDNKNRLYLETVKLAVDEFYRELLPIVNGPGVSFMRVIDNAITFLREHPENDLLLSSLRGEHPRPVVSEAARLVDARAVAMWRCWIGQSGANGHQALASANEGNLARLIATMVSGVLATRFLEEDFDARAALADFGTLIESSPVVQPENVLAAAGGARD